MNGLTTTWQQDYDVLMPPNPDKDTKSRLGYFLDWLALTGRNWLTPDLAAYRDYLLTERSRINPYTGAESNACLAPNTVAAHLATIRGRYQELLRDKTIQQRLYKIAPHQHHHAFVARRIDRLQHALDPATAPVDGTDTTESTYLHLNATQVKRLLRTPGVDTLPGLRDTAMIAMMLCTGIRESELVLLDVTDLRQRINGDLTLRIRDSKAPRYVPYHGLNWCLVYVEEWMLAAEIFRGAVFRGFYRGSKRVRETRISRRAVNHILNRYAIRIGDEMRVVTSHDLRHTYARNAYESGIPVTHIQQYLGHSTLQTTLAYIGDVQGERRQRRHFKAPHQPAEVQQWA